MDKEGLINQYKKAALLQNEAVMKKLEFVRAKSAYGEGQARETDIKKAPANQPMLLLLGGIIIAFFGVMCFLAIFVDSLPGAVFILVFCFVAAVLSIFFAKKLNRKISNESSRQNVEYYHRSVVEPLAKKAENCKKIYQAAKAVWEQMAEELSIPESCRNQEALQCFVKYLESGRAHTAQECIYLYEKTRQSREQQAYECDISAGEGKCLVCGSLQCELVEETENVGDSLRLCKNCGRVF